MTARGRARWCLGPGCHELTLLAESQPPGGPSVDLDLVLVEADTGARLAFDRKSDADAAVSVCLGSAQRTELQFMGAPPDTELLSAHAGWDLPSGLPDHLGPKRARGWRASRANKRLNLIDQPIYSSLGVQGLTQLPLEVEPGLCYSAIVAPLRGEVRALALAARAEAAGEVSRTASDSGGHRISFCAHGARRARLEVEGEGASLAWFVALWENGRSAVGIEER